jgi:hypothetical protein
MDGRLDDVMFCWDATFLLVKWTMSFGAGCLFNMRKRWDYPVCM